MSLTTQAAADPTIYSDPPIYSVSAFCEAHHIARSFFYQLLPEGRAPRVTKLGRRTFVTREAAAEWRRRIEQETHQEERTSTSFCEAHQSDPGQGQESPRDGQGRA
jgi:predicted DNA-binding transcriptional regulator AlpA